MITTRTERRRWEIFIPKEDREAFEALLFDIDFGKTDASNYDGKTWIICYASEEFKIIARLRFIIEELPAYGTEIDFSD